LSRPGRDHPLPLVYLASSRGPYPHYPRPYGYDYLYDSLYLCEDNPPASAAKGLARPGPSSW